ncbi:MAG: putative quinol monooxygenase [Halobacteriaceae archaeon]
MIILHAKLPIKEEKMDEALELAKKLVEKSNQEEGMIDYRATRDIEDNNIIRFFEQYEDAEAFQAHNETSHFQEFEEKIPDLLANEPEIIKFKVSETTELEP